METRETVDFEYKINSELDCLQESFAGDPKHSARTESEDNRAIHHAAKKAKRQSPKKRKETYERRHEAKDGKRKQHLHARLILISEAL